MVKQKKGTWPVLRSITVKWLCSNGHEVETVDCSISASGGCCGGHGEGEYCYCPNPEAIVAVDCPVCKVLNEFDY